MTRSTRAELDRFLPKLDDDTRWLLESELRCCRAARQADTELAWRRDRCRGQDDPAVKLLDDLAAGVSLGTAQSLLAAIGDIGRFRDR